MDESAVGVLVRSARDTRLRGGRLTLCGADARVRDALERIGVARLVHLADDAAQRARSPAAPPDGSLAGNLAAPGPIAQLVEQGTLNPKVVGSIPTRPIPESPCRPQASGWRQAGCDQAA